MSLDHHHSLISPGYVLEMSQRKISWIWRTIPLYHPNFFSISSLVIFSFVYDGNWEWSLRYLISNPFVFFLLVRDIWIPRFRLCSHHLRLPLLRLLQPGWMGEELQRICAVSFILVFLSLGVWNPLVSHCAVRKLYTCLCESVSFALKHTQKSTIWCCWVSKPLLNRSAYSRECSPISPQCWHWLDWN